MSKKIAVVTGASAGIGSAIVRQLADAGFDVVAGARRIDRVEAVTGPVGGTAHALDVTDPGSVDAFASKIQRAHLLVNNAGLGLGLDRVEAADEAAWRTMYDTNVLGVMRVTRALLPKLIESGDGHVVNIGSIAGFETYPGGAGYTASKHALRALTRTLRIELLGQPVRVTDIAPGMVETEFSLVRFGGDAERASSIYDGMTPLTAEDIAACVTFAATAPSHVNIDEIVVRPRDQATATAVHRRQE